jgi:restriction system protein
LKFRMAQNSLFAILLRSPWWISAAIALALALFGLAVLSDPFRILAIVSGVPFALIGAVAARRQWHLPSAVRVSETRDALARMPWSAFGDLLEQSFRRDGYTVSKSKAGAVDFELNRNGRRTLVCARRWKSARTGLEAVQALQAERDAADQPDGLYIGLGALTDTALPFAKEHGIAVWDAGDLARALRGLPLGNASRR